jgi:hypothetical protein
MTKSVNLQHRHFVLIAETIAALPDTCNRSVVAIAFADKLASTNPRFDRGRFLACAMGQPSTGRDCTGER